MRKTVAAFTKNTGQHDVGRWESWSCDETTAKKGHHFVGMTQRKKAPFEKRAPVFMGKNRGDTVNCGPG